MLFCIVGYPKIALCTCINMLEIYEKFIQQCIKCSLKEVSKLSIFLKRFSFSNVLLESLLRSRSMPYCKLLLQKVSIKFSF